MAQSDYRSINPYLMTEVASFPLIDDDGITHDAPVFGTDDVAGVRR